MNRRAVPLALFLAACGGSDTKAPTPDLSRVTLDLAISSSLPAGNTLSIDGTAVTVTEVATTSQPTLFRMRFTGIAGDAADDLLVIANHVGTGCAPTDGGSPADGTANGVQLELGSGTFVNTSVDATCGMEVDTITPSVTGGFSGQTSTNDQQTRQVVVRFNIPIN